MMTQKCRVSFGRFCGQARGRLKTFKFILFRDWKKDYLTAENAKSTKFGDLLIFPPATRPLCALCVPCGSKPPCLSIFRFPRKLHLRSSVSICCLLYI